MLQIYEKYGFKLFPCKIDKSPNITQMGIGWRDPEAHLTIKQATELMERGHLIGAWIPENMIVIDIDRNHVDKFGNPKEDGMEHFKMLCKEHGLSELSKHTLVVKTGSGGFHLYYEVPEILPQRQLCKSVDTRTHNGYVIACGSAGYELFNDAPPAVLPQAFQILLRNKQAEKAPDFKAKRPLSVELLKRLLKHIPAQNFGNNEEWLEFTMSIIATCGNAQDVIEAVVEWSETDPAYKDDGSLRVRVESFSPDGAITPATFLYILKKEGISPYFIHQVRKQIGAEYEQNTEAFISHYDLPFALNEEQLDDRAELVKGFFFLKDQASTSRLFEYLVRDKLIYDRGEREFYYFNGSRWVLYSDILTLIFNILVVVADKAYLKFAKEEPDGIEILNEVFHIVGNVSWRQKIEQSIRISEMISAKSYPWDAPETAETLTFKDSCIDFSNGLMTVRQGKPEEYRRSFIDLPADEVMKAKDPEVFNRALADIFKDDETRKTALQAISLSVSGTGKYRKFQIWNGAGKNGKSFLMEVLQKVIGDRAITYNTSLLLQKKGGEDANAVTPGMARFQGALLACGSETEDLRKISQGIIKNITGNETMTANPKYKDEVSFQTTFQVILATNYLPSFSAYDEAFIDRLLIIPFNTSFYSDEKQKQAFIDRRRKYIVEAQDGRELMSKILEERAGIIRLFIRTYLDIGRSLTVSKECEDLLAVYVEDNNDLGQFLDTYCIFEEDGFAPTKTMVDFFNDENNSRYSSQWMGKRLKQLHPELIASRKRYDGSIQRGFTGITLMQEGVDSGESF